MKKTVLKVFAAIVCLAVVFAVRFPSSAAPVDTTASADLTITLAPDGVPVQGSEFRLYRIADISRNGNVTLTPPFSDFPVVLEERDADSLRKLAQTLKGYVIMEGVEPDCVGTTDGSGKVYFENIPLGMYLVVGTSVRVGNTIYVPETFIVTLPAEAENGSWQYNVNVRTKALAGMSGAKVDLRVLKVWDDGGDSSARPSEITVELYSGTLLYDTVVLSKENNWHHTWNQLVGIDWTVVEKSVPDGYNVTVERDGNSFIITNTKDDKTENPDPDDPDSTNPDATAPGQTNPDSGDISYTDNNGNTDNEVSDGSGNPTTGIGEESKPTLPQTGMLWWPVPVFAFAGLLLLMLGWRLSRRNEDES